MSAGAIRQGRVFVEIGADPKQFLSAVGQVNRQIGEVGKSAMDVGVRLAAVGGAITAPIAAAAAQFANLGELVKDIQQSAGLGSGDINGLTKAAAELGLVLDRDTARASLQLAASMSKMRLSILAVGATVGSIVAPEFTGFAEAIGRVSKDISDFIRRNRQIVTVALAVGGALFAIGTALTFIGGAMKSFAGNTSFLAGPIIELVRGSAALAANVARLGVAFVAANPVAAVLTAALVAGGVAAVQAAGGFAGLASVLSGAFKAAVDAVTATFPNLTEIVGTTIAGSYNAIAAGDFAGAANILWAGTKAAWIAGTSALMGVLDPFIETAQNAWGEMGTTLAIMWEQMWVTLATGDWGQYLLGAFDNIINSVMGLWDSLVGSIQKGWAYIQGTFRAGFDVEAEIKRIDAANTARAQQRSLDRPGFAGRVGISDEEKAKILADSQARIDALVAGNEESRQRRADATRERAQERPREVAAAIDDLKQAVAAQVAGNPPLAKIAPQALSGPAQTIGTFSAVAAGGLGFGTKGIPEQQLDVLKQIAAGVRGGFGNVGP